MTVFYDKKGVKALVLYPREECPDCEGTEGEEYSIGSKSIVMVICAECGTHWPKAKGV